MECVRSVGIHVHRRRLAGLRQGLVHPLHTLDRYAGIGTSVQPQHGRIDLPDEIDLASSEYSQSMVFRLRDREKFLLKKIEKALARIDDGTFGVCERCEEDISVKRLEARPVTTLCIRCKEEQEKKEK